jgi:D-beta-D-heptose 7-phosphate kinase/D-beta-D-heptose 1-phosphate adenosyltransferase
MSDERYDIMILSGGFDPLHVGHIRMIQAARDTAGLVVVGVNSDEWVTRSKGFCFLPMPERCEILASVRGVTSAVPFADEDNTAIDLIRRVHAMASQGSKIAFGNGGDRTEGNVPEVEICKRLGIDLVWNVGGGPVSRSKELWEKAKAMAIRTAEGAS